MLDSPLPPWRESILGILSFEAHETARLSLQDHVLTEDYARGSSHFTAEQVVARQLSIHRLTHDGFPHLAFPVLHPGRLEMDVHGRAARSSPRGRTNCSMGALGSSPSSESGRWDRIANVSQTESKTSAGARAMCPRPVGRRITKVWQQLFHAPLLCC